MMKANDCDVAVEDSLTEMWMQPVVGRLNAEPNLQGLLRVSQIGSAEND